MKTNSVINFLKVIWKESIFYDLIGIFNFKTLIELRQEVKRQQGK